MNRKTLLIILQTLLSFMIKIVLNNTKIHCRLDSKFEIYIYIEYVNKYRKKKDILGRMTKFKLLL